MAITYYKCKCGKFVETRRAEFTSRDKAHKNPMCKACFDRYQDNLAYSESNGEFRNYEDWMESRGATVCHMDTLQREH